MKTKQTPQAKPDATTSRGSLKRFVSGMRMKRKQHGEKRTAAVTREIIFPERINKDGSVLCKEVRTTYNIATMRGKRSYEFQLAYLERENKEWAEYMAQEDAANAQAHPHEEKP